MAALLRSFSRNKNLSPGWFKAQAGKQKRFSMPLKVPARLQKRFSSLRQGFATLQNVSARLLESFSGEKNRRANLLEAFSGALGDGGYHGLWSDGVYVAVAGGAGIFAGRENVPA
ncbi:MAG: hypothetical protein QM813_16360 [Verrucomicrobiota bacterium]